MGTVAYLYRPRRPRYVQSIVWTPPLKQVLIKISKNKMAQFKECNGTRLDNLISDKKCNHWLKVLVVEF